jgi:putative spermidine/putrescine transport system ATP-binding protein
MSPQPEAHLEVVDLGMRFGAGWAVKDSTFTVQRGEFFGLLGPSGCGKSTTLNIVAGFLDPTEGDVILGGNSLLGVPPHKRDTAMVFQDYALFPHLSAAENVGFGLKLRKVGGARLKARVDELLALVGLSAKRDNMPWQLSGGEQQRISLARALAVEPSIVLLDEPLSNLDARLRDQMRKEIKRILGGTGVTVLFVTHDQSEAFSMCDRVAVMFDGRIQQLAEPTAIYSEPASRRIAEFIGENNTFAATIDDDGATVQIHIGSIAVSSSLPAGSSAAAGARGSAMIRPECVRIGPADATEPDGRSVVTGNVVKTDFLGPTVQYTVDVPGGVINALRFSNDAELLRLGDSVRLSWKPADVLFYDEAVE